MGRSFAVRLAEEGADIIAVDLCQDIDGLPYQLGTDDDLAETARLVKATGQRVVAVQADVRDEAAIEAAVATGVTQLGRLDVVVANAGIFTFNPDTHKVARSDWQNVVDVNLTGTWQTIKAATPALLDAGSGGSVIMINSQSGLRGLLNVAAYTSTKFALVGLMKVLVGELGVHGIRVNSIHPNCVETEMCTNETTRRLFRPDLDPPTVADIEPVLAAMNPMGVGMIDPIHVANAVLFLASDESLYVSGAQLPVDAGAATT
jgi:(-)-trans-carveol dehydrogenase